jgi:hypothetical protein
MTTRIATLTQDDAEVVTAPTARDLSDRVPSDL